MVTVRRWYVFLVCAISLHAAAWAAIALLRSLLVLGREVVAASIAFQIAVIVIGLPLFLVHWLWAQRLAQRESDERQSVLRRLYLYGTLAGLLGPFLVNAFGLAAVLLRALLGAGRPAWSLAAEAGLDKLAALIPLAALWFYHRRVIAADAESAPESGAAATVRRWYILVFSAAGAALVTLGAIHLLRWILFQLWGATALGVAGRAALAGTLAQLAVGLPLWLVFWHQAQRLFAGPPDEERQSVLRKFYLYAVIFVAVLATVSNATLILGGALRRLLGLLPSGDIRLPLPIMAGAAVLWAYHAHVLRGDVALAGEAPRQADLRRLYQYLVAAVGLAACLIGLGGDISVLLRSLTPQGMAPGLKEQLAWFTAALIAGLPVWGVPWRQAQLAATAPPPLGTGERRSVVRKIYLYFFLLAATLTVLSGAVYVVYRLLSLALGERGEASLLSDIGQAVAYVMIGVGVWLYHGSAVRGDGQMERRERADRLSGLRVVVVDFGEARLGRAVVEALQREAPEIRPGLVALPPDAQADAPALQAQLEGAGLIVGPWTIAAAPAIAGHPARKLLAPVGGDGLDWAGVDAWDDEALARQAARAIQQILSGESVRPARPLGAGAIVGIIFGVLVGLGLLIIVLSAILENV